MFELSLRSARKSATPSQAIGVQLRCERLEERVVPSGGALDPSFGQGGIASTPVDGTPLGVAEQADGKLVVVLQGRLDHEGFVLTRYNADGTVDTSFGTGGLVDLAFAHHATSCSVLIQADGKIVVGGAAEGDQTLLWVRMTDFALARFNADGSLDTSFGSGGTVTTPFLQQSSGIGSIVLQTDGRILVEGDVGEVSTVARYNTDGSLDTTFGTAGFVQLTVPGTNMYSPTMLLTFKDLEVQPDGKILIMGHINGDSSGDWLARLNADGSTDESFQSIAHALPGCSSAAFSLEPDGKIVVVGSKWILDDGDLGGLALARFNSDGTPDAGFGEAGKVSIPFTINHERVNNVMVDQQGRIIVTGSVPSGIDPFQWNGNFTLRRFNGDGTVDMTFGDGGEVSTAAAFATSSIFQTDGKTVVVGTYPYFAPSYVVLARFLDDDGGPPPLAPQPGDGGPRSFAATGNSGPRSLVAMGHGGSTFAFSPQFFIVDGGSGSTNHSTTQPAAEVPATRGLNRRGPTSTPTDPAFLGGVFVG